MDDIEILAFYRGGKRMQIQTNRNQREIKAHGDFTFPVLVSKECITDYEFGTFSSLDRVLEHVEYVVMNYRPVLNGEHYLTGEEVCERLCISKRTLQDYRDTGLLGYVQLPGKIIYRESEILDLLERYYRK